MPKRIGFLYERFVSLSNCVEAEKNIGKHKPDNKMARKISANAEFYGEQLHKKLADGTFAFHESKSTTICDSYKGKKRELKIPCLEDQAAQQAWLNIATPYIERRNYYYNCGSIPGAGQSRAVNALKKWLSKHHYKYGQTTDIRKFYETCPHSMVINGLRRIFKDEKFINFARQILASMSDTGVGLAIGHPSSHWFANVALMTIDHQLKRKFPDIKFTRYMDDVAMVSDNKRKLRQARSFIEKVLCKYGMKLKNNWQIFKIKARGLTFLSYRFFHGYTLLAKKLMYRIARKMKKAGKGLSLRMAQGVVSYLGILKHCNSYNFRVAHVYPYINPKTCRRLISNAAKNFVRQAA